jgi:hypothetical protein
MSEFQLVFLQGQLEKLRRRNTGLFKMDFAEPIVKIFDWGRSEFSTMKTHKKLSAAEKDSRVFHWRLYIQGICTLLFQWSRLYLHRFCNGRGWSSICVEIRELCSMHAGIIAVHTVSDHECIPFRYMHFEALQ